MHALRLTRHAASRARNARRRGRCALLSAFVLGLLAPHALPAQELNARVTINHQQVQGTSTSVFETLEAALTEFLNERQWTQMQYAPRERIACNFAITVSKYAESENSFQCTLTVQATRPVYGSTYSTVSFSTKDANYTFTYQEYDKLDFRLDQIDNNLTAVLAYYAYLIIGLDMDTMSRLGGTAALQEAMNIVSAAQSLPGKGWKAFEDSKNRHAVVSDLLDGGMEPFRRMLYAYHREGLDAMAENADRGRAAISESLALLAEARQNKSLSMLPQLFVEYKRDELVNIYKGHGTPKEKSDAYDLLMQINPSQSRYWNDLKK